ncbi:MAG: (Fe-S)-binding protein [Thermoleophilia bacterium]
MGSDTPTELSSLYEQVAKCGKCGFCQPACPIYRTTYREAHVARGKHALMRNIIEGKTVLDADLRDAFDNCLLCRACTASCFSDLRTDRLVVAFRETYARRFGRSTLQRLIFRGLLPDPRLMRTVARAAWLARGTGLDGLAVRSGLLDMINPKLKKALELREGSPGAFLRQRLARTAATGDDGRRARARTPARAHTPIVLPPISDASSDVNERVGEPVKVGYWISCGYNYMLPEVGEATVSVLRRAGASVEVLENSCCGLPAYGYGDVDGARALARGNLETMGDLSRFDYIVSECGSCSGHLKEYPELLAADPEFAVRARRMAAKVRSFSEFLGEWGVPVSTLSEAAAPAASAGPPNGADPWGLPDRPLVVTFHEPCHLGARFQGVVQQPRDLLRSLPGVEFRELPDADSCCGAAGSYNMVNPEVSGAILARKMEKVATTGADVLVTECPSCMIQLSLGARRAGSSVRVLGISELLAGLSHRSVR